MSRQAAAIDKADGRTLRSGFLRRAAERPEAPCLVVRGTAHSYGEVEQAARLWAGAIVGAIGRPAIRVGVHGARSLVSHAGVLAALCSGGAFVPLNPFFPSERTREMIAQAGLDAIICEAKTLPALMLALDGVADPPLLILPDCDRVPEGAPDALAAGDIAAGAPLAGLPPLLAGDLAYLLFTSGSTGRPKGVPITHANALHFVDFATAHYAVSADDRFSQTFDQTFDLSVFDLFVAWESGASVYVMQSLDLIAPARFIAANALTIWFSVPSIPALMRRKGTLKPGALPSLRLSLFCGEPLPAETAAAWQAAAPNSIVENLYGPTELTIACLWYRWDAERSPGECLNGLVPIGRPFPGLGAALLDEHLGPAGADGGELCVCGPQTSPGYWRDPEKTADRFVTLPGAGFPAERFYRTGDRALRLPSGDYAYLGRTDHQIKVMGYRVELGEIEACLRADGAVVEAVAIGWPVAEGSASGLVAFVTGDGIDPEGLRQHARRSLPDYMVPAEIRVVPAMPLNANGKIDRNALTATLAP